MDCEKCGKAIPPAPGRPSKFCAEHRGYQPKVKGPSPSPRSKVVKEAVPTSLNKKQLRTLLENFVDRRIQQALEKNSGNRFRDELIGALSTEPHSEGPVSKRHIPDSAK